MQRRNIFALAALAAAGFTGGWWAANTGTVVTPASAVENTYGRGFFAGGMHGRGFGHDRLIGWITAEIERELDLGPDQKRALSALTESAEETVAKAEAAFDHDRDAMRTLPLPEQIRALRSMAQAADTLLEEIEAPVAAFDATLTDEQRDKLNALMQSHRDGRDGRRGWRRHRG